ncbi:MAG TPA: pilus assembly protein PilP [Steroidobacteraceae bacterium]|jgi:type IV pilus assembly protein PilP|nr:pilus assembly protein PilP [Steroidobacteraceae bacterium]
MLSKPNKSWLLIGAICALSGVLSGCTSKDDELEQFIADTKKEPGGRVEPLPELKPYETYAYESSNLRSPFMPGGSGAGPGVRPDSRRNREFLEQFSLDTLRMVGTLRLSDRTYGLVKTKDGLVHRVLPGNYMGQADGRVTEISPSKISVVEIVPDGLGGYIERPAALALNN